MPPASMAGPGGYDFARTAWFKSLGGTGTALGPVRTVAPPAAGPFADRLAAWRARLTAHVQGRAGEGAGIAAALANNDRCAIALAEEEAMRASGLAHLLSISGLHITAVVGAAMLLVTRLLNLSLRLALHWRLPLVGAAAGAGTGLAHTLLTGAGVPTVRSCVAALLVLAGLAIGREAITLRLMATGALIVMLL